MKESKIWDEQILDCLTKAIGITNEYSNPFINDAFGSSECRQIVETLLPWIERLSKEIQYRKEHSV